jgi:hypothetical protein
VLTDSETGHQNQLLQVNEDIVDSEIKETIMAETSMHSEGEVEEKEINLED